MCLGVPGKVRDITRHEVGMQMGRVLFGGIQKEVCHSFLPDINVGDYVIVHAGFAISQVDEEEGPGPSKSCGRWATSPSCRRPRPPQFRRSAPMRFVDEYRDGEAVRRAANAIASVQTKPWTLMEICGGQTHSILKFGLDQGLKNFSVLCSHVLVPPAIDAILGAPDCRIQGFLAGVTSARWRAARTTCPWPRSTASPSWSPASNPWTS
jgi:hydrogenase assembly chaperone HypC/HupF